MLQEKFEISETLRRLQEVIEFTINIHSVLLLGGQMGQLRQCQSNNPNG